MPIVRLKKYPECTGNINQLNTHGLGEVVGGIGEDYDSWFIKDLDVYLEATKEWKDLSQAFHDHDIIVDNYNQYFSEPKTEEERKRGWY